MIWTIYKFTRGKTHAGNAYDELGETEAPHQPAAWHEAMKRFPDLAKASDGYQNGRILVRPKGDHSGMPGWKDVAK